MNEVAGNMSNQSFNNQHPTIFDVPLSGQGVSHDVAATVIIAILVFLIVFSSILAIGYVYSGRRHHTSNNRSIARRALAERNRSTTFVTFPLRTSHQSSQVHITITDDIVTSIRYSASKRALRLPADEEPPKYEDINAVSFPTSSLPSSCQTADALPTYDSVDL